MSAVLEPLLGYELALERANNIAQVLAFKVDDVVGIAFGMLRQTGLTDTRRVAEDLARAWHHGAALGAAQDTLVEESALGSAGRAA